MKNQDKLLNIIKELYNVSGFRISIYSTDFCELIAYPETKLGFCQCLQNDPEAKSCCSECDRAAFEEVKKTGKTHLYTCHFGLIEAVSPIYHYGVLSGYLMMGQVRSDSGADAGELLRLTDGIADKNAMAALVEKIPVIPRDKIESFVNIMTVCAEYITLSNIMQIFGRNLAELTRLYINSHFSEDITLDLLCENFNCSKTTLLSAYKKTYGITVYRDLTDIRLEHAKNLIGESAYSIGEISSRCGFADQCYFSKVFSKKYGIPPTAYRENVK
jgi:AraC-like DNA-binding protein